MKVSGSDLLERNLAAYRAISPDGASLIENSETDFEIIPTSSEFPTLKSGNVLLHSSRDPWTEAKRQLAELKKGDEERAFLFFGAGLGYSVLHSLEFEKLICVWMEPFPGILKIAFSLSDFSESISNGRLRIFLPPYEETSFYEGFKGISGLPVSFIPHRGSLQWNPEKYQELRFLSEAFFHKKDVNTATLTRFEKVWTSNFLRNLPELSELAPIAELFGVCDSRVDVVVCGAGPSLSRSLEDLKRFRDNFVLIAVDTALLVLQKAGVDPDLVFSVDPQPLNSKYLEGYEGNAKFVFDPTTSYHSLRMSYHTGENFVTSSPFPWIKILQNSLEGEIGTLDFGGSVSTNASSLGEKMGARALLFVGQDLSFPGTLAHCKGAILEERLNYLESRTFRRELHNFKQMSALPVKWADSLDGGKIRTNEKLLIFKKWFEERTKDRPWRNMGKEGVRLEGVPSDSFSAWYEKNPSDSELVSRVRNSLKGPHARRTDRKRILEELKTILSQLREFRTQVNKGEKLSQRIYRLIQDGEKDKPSIQAALREISAIDDSVSSKKGLTEFLGMSLQRVILAITEGYETELSLEEKKNERLAIAKKSVLLYTGLKEATDTNLRLLGKAWIRISP